VEAFLKWRRKLGDRNRYPDLELRGRERILVEIEIPAWKVKRETALTGDEWAAADLKLRQLRGQWQAIRDRWTRPAGSICGSGSRRLIETGEPEWDPFHEE
jgi:hypothetical protein